MARIPQDELERLKTEVSVQRLVEARGVELKQMGKDLRGRCLFHDDHDPSFSIDPVRNVFHCFGCGVKGSVIDLVMLLEGVTFRHAVEILRADYPGLGDGPADRPPVKKSSTVKLPPLVEDTEASDAELRGRVADYYHETLKQSPEALEYLENRGLRSAEMVERFKLGYANRTLGYHLPQRNRKNGKEIRGRLEELGIIKNTGHELMRGSLVIPLFDSHGRVVQMYGRKIGEGLRPGVPKHLYLPGPRRGVFNLDALKASKEIILCEALIDALTLWSHGFRNVTTAYGINGFTTEHLDAFKAHGVTRILIAYDRDERGEPAAQALAERLIAEDLECFRIELPPNMDINEFALKVTPAAKSLALLIRSAKWLGKGKSPGRPTSCPINNEPLVLNEEPAEPPIKQPVDKQSSEKPMNSKEITEPEPASSLVAASEPEATVKTQEVAASPLPAAPKLDVPAEVKSTGVYITLGDRIYRVRGLAKNMAYDVLKINLMVTSAEHVHVDSFNLYSSRQRNIFSGQAALELAVKESVIKQDLRKVLLKLEELQEQQIRNALEPKDNTVHLNDRERSEALAFLQDPKLLDRIVADFSTCGLVGEHTNKLVGYLAAVSRKLAKPIGVLVQSSSAAGKSALMDAVLAFMPEEERVSYSAMTGQSLFYMGETDLQNKILAIAEEEGAERASYALKLLQSEGELSIASTGKDPSSGRLVTHEYHVEGPAAILLTTTAIDLDEELQNRCIVLAVDESREQTIAIHEEQRMARTREGAIRRKRRPRIRKLHRNAQRLLRSLVIRNPYSARLTFPNEATRTRRDQEKYLTLIDAIALMHQHQRKVMSDVVDGERDEYIEVTLDDIAVANRLANDALGRMLDELPPQTRRFLEMIHKMVDFECQRRKIEQAAYRFSRWDVRMVTGSTYAQVRRHLDRLVEMEYLLVHRGGRGQSFVYELLWDGQGIDGTPFVMGLINIDKLQESETTTESLTLSEPSLTPSEGEFDPPLTPHCPPFDPPLLTEVSCDNPSDNSNSGSDVEETPEKRTSGHTPKSESYPHQRRHTIALSASARGE